VVLFVLSRRNKVHGFCHRSWSSSCSYVSFVRGLVINWGTEEGFSPVAIRGVLSTMAQALASSLCVRSPIRLLIPSSSLEPTVCPPCSSTVCVFPRASLFSFHSCFDAVLSSPAHYSYSRAPRIAAASASAATSNELISSQVRLYFRFHLEPSCGLFQRSPL